MHLCKITLALSLIVLTGCAGQIQCQFETEDERMHRLITQAMKTRILDNALQNELKEEQEAIQPNGQKN